MALDWKKQVSIKDIAAVFRKGKKGGQAKSGYPTKTTMNLYQGESHGTNYRKVIVTAILLVIGISLFVKFGVLDLITRVSEKEAELITQKQIAVTTLGATRDYSEVKTLYDAYEARLGGAAVDVIAVLDMVEKEVMKSAEVTSIVVSDGTLTLTLYNVPLNTVGDLAKSIEGQELVSSVNVSTATTQNADGQNTVSTLVISLVGVASEEE